MSGLQLWRRCFPVDEKYWRPRLRSAGRWIDRLVPLIVRLVARHDRDWQNETFYNTAASHLGSVDNIVLSRIKKRVDVARLPTFLRVIGEVGTGEFIDFEAQIPGEEQATDRAVTILALDLAAADRHSILGQKLNLTRVLPTSLEDLSKAFRQGRFEEIASAPAEEVAKARNDARNAVAVGFYFHEGSRWVYGEEAFGLRLISWIARKAPDAVVDGMMILMFRLRQVPNAVISSDKIENMARTAYRAFLGSKQLESFWRNDRRFSEILNPTRIKSAFTDEISLKRWQRELNAIILEAAAKTPMGAIDDDQEVGKSH
jgi:hypothetical protein